MDSQDGELILVTLVIQVTLNMDRIMIITITTITEVVVDVEIKLVMYAKNQDISQWIALKEANSKNLLEEETEMAIDHLERKHLMEEVRIEDQINLMINQIDMMNLKKWILMNLTTMVIGLTIKAIANQLKIMKPRVGMLTAIHLREEELLMIFL